MTKRKTNPYQLTDDEKLDVVDLYAQFRTTSQIVDQVMGWKPNAATGDTEKDRKHVRDAIRTCNPKSSAFSFQIALTAKRAEYLAERKGSLVAAVCQTADAFAQGLSDIKFDFSSVTATDLPKIVLALKSLVELMSKMGITVRQDINHAVRFGERLDQHPRNKADSNSIPYPETRREMWAESESYELAKSDQIETGTGRNAQHVDGRVYPSNYEIPDMYVKELWEMLCKNGHERFPSIKQMRRDLDDPELYEEVFGGDAVSFEEVLEIHRSMLSDDWRSYTANRRNEELNLHRLMNSDEVKRLAEAISSGKLDLSSIFQNKNESQSTDTAKLDSLLETPSGAKSKNGKRGTADVNNGPPPTSNAETATDLTPKDKAQNNAHPT